MVARSSAAAVSSPATPRFRRFAHLFHQIKRGRIVLLANHLAQQVAKHPNIGTQTVTQVGGCVLHSLKSPKVEGTYCNKFTAAWLAINHKIISFIIMAFHDAALHWTVADRDTRIIGGRSLKKTRRSATFSVSVAGTQDGL